MTSVSAGYIILTPTQPVINAMHMILKMLQYQYPKVRCNKGQAETLYAGFLVQAN